MKLENGRKYFWQWELDQRLEAPEGCTQVHFANGTSDKALVLEVFEENNKRMVKVPNEMLQVAAQLRCYAWDGENVIEVTSFDVLPREKPEDYMYEPEEVRRFDKLEADLAMRSQGRNASYTITTPGWKRILNIIRATSGRVDIGSASGFPYRMVQSLSFDFTGFVKYSKNSGSEKPVLIKRYENIFGESDGVDEHPYKIKKIRIGYPADGTDFPNAERDYRYNPVNCYLDVYIDFDKADHDSIAFGINYVGDAEAHNCTAITEETDAVDTGIYGENLTYYEVDVDTMPKYYNSDMSLPYLDSSCTHPGYGTQIKDAKYIAVYPATIEDIDKATHRYRVITPQNVGYAVEVHAPAAVIDDTTSAEVKTWSSKKIGTQLFKCYEYAANQAKGVINDVAVTDKAWSSKNTVDKLCPSFTESGAVAVCEPVEGYPLNVVSDINSDNPGSITLYHSGKNLIGFDDFSGITATSRTASCINGVHKVVYTGGVTTSYLVINGAIDYFKGGYLPAGTYIFSVNQESRNGKTLSGCYATVDLEDGTTVNLPAGKAVTLTMAGTVTGFRCSNTAIQEGTELTFTLQIEVGSVATAYEPYRGQTYTVDIPKGLLDDDSGNTYDWETGLLLVSGLGQWYQHDIQTNEFIPTDYWAWDDISEYPAQKLRNIPANPGTNYLYSNWGNTTVSGRADPIAIIAKQEERLAALEAAIINNT